jgi:hypothetical protein
MSAKQQNRTKLKRLAASAGHHGSNSGDAAFAQVSSYSLPTQPSSSAATLQMARIAHDFNNVLTLVLGYGENLLKALPKGHPGRSFVEEICRAAKDGERLSVELMSMAQCGRAENSASTAR